MNLFFQHNLYINKHFKGLKLKSPLFFSGFPALRFDLQDENASTSRDTYLDEVLKRMKKIHAVSTEWDDDIFIFYQEHTYKRSKIRKHSYLFRQFDANTVQMKFRKKQSIIYESERSCKAENTSQVLISDKAANINFNNIYLGIANKDFNRKPYINGELFIINLTKETVLFMYDDRGCDLISPNLTLIKNYYSDLTNLILEANRPEIIKRLQRA